ncbi:isoprenoid synthase domain-containing protein [Mycena belliarum]|uniref:Terpene synthase n=1 Tax=Mycena belliarum TaxID=1033014 RepID=A0AAD6UIC7_9AGAR|nr:isoprenoid synthase domain-containing protein [Mycena belliae]
MASNVPRTLRLPRTMDSWPWTRQINPLHEEVSAECMLHWSQNLKVFSLESQKKFDAGLLAALVYPNVSKEILRTGCDWITLFFLVDHCTDMQSEKTARQMVDIALDALNNPEKPRPEGETMLGQATKEFWSRALKGATETAARHFFRAFTNYLESVVLQAAGRDNNRLATMTEYFHVRRQNVGTFPTYCIGAWHLDLPDHVFYNEVIVDMTNQIADMVIIDNDLISYNKEQAAGDDKFNVVTVAMHHLNTDYGEAVAWITAYHAATQAKFLACLTQVPSFGPIIDSQLQEYIFILANMPRANDCWNFECALYYGSKGFEVQQTRSVALLSKVHG